MPKQSKLPIEGQAIRFAPSRNGEPLTTPWKVWAEGNEVYAVTRSSTGTTHISAHGSGQVHYRLATKLKRDLAPIMPFESSAWFHAFEIRFLWGTGALSPVGQRESLKRKQGHLIEVPEDFVFHANLIIGAAGTPLDISLPVELTGQTLWRTRLRDGRIAVLVGRMLPLDERIRKDIRHFREELKIQVTLSKMSKNIYPELLNIHGSPGEINVISVVPLGEQVFRSEQETPSTDQRPRRFLYRNPRSAVDLIAPNGNRVAVVEAAEFAEQFELIKGLPKLVELGSLTMRLESNNLIAGSLIKALTPQGLVCIPTVDGGSPKHDWVYTIHSRFDGSCLTAEINAQSTALRNNNLVQPLANLDESEELVLVVPAETLKLTATLDRPLTSTKLLGRFTLRDRR